MSYCNEAFTPVSCDADVHPGTEEDRILSAAEHKLYRRHIGELIIPWCLYQT